MRLVFAGTPQAAVPSLQALLDGDHEVVAVLTRPDAPSGRGRELHASPVRKLAERRGVPVLTPRRVSDPGLLEQLRQLHPDACPVVAYGNLIRKDALAVPRYGWINLHFSLLPAWRGAAPVQHAVMAGDQVTGATTFRLDEGMDTGPVLGRMTEQIGPRDTGGDLLRRLADGGAQLLVATLDAIAAGTITAEPQPEEGVSLAPKLTVQDGRIDWRRPAFAIDRRIRAVTPEPGAWTTLHGRRLGLGPLAEAAPPGLALRPGGLRVGKRSVDVGTSTGPVRLGTVQPVGKKAMPAADWARGARLNGDEVLGE